MAAAIATLPWVEKDTIRTSGTTLQAKFAVTDPKLFDEAVVIETIRKKGYPGATRIAGPGPKTE